MPPPNGIPQNNPPEQPWMLDNFETGFPTAEQLQRDVTATAQQIDRDQLGRFAPRAMRFGRPELDWAVDMGIKPKAKSTVKKEERIYEVRVEQVKGIYHVRVHVVNDKDVMIDEYKVKTLAEVQETVRGFVESYSDPNNGGYNPHLIDVRTRTSSRLRGHLTRDQRAIERQHAVVDVVKEDEFALEVYEEEVERTAQPIPF